MKTIISGLGLLILCGGGAIGFSSDSNIPTHNRWSNAQMSGGGARSLFQATPNPVYQKIFSQVSQQSMQMLLKSVTGVVPVTVNGATYSITDRYTPAMKAKFRTYWIQYFNSLGIQAREMAYNTSHHMGEAQGHNLEAVLPGKSKDSIVIIVHYDSMGRGGHETENPAVDDDMSGMAMLMETARILAQYKNNIQNTVRFVAADYEEVTGPGLEGARVYAKYLKQLSQQEQFKVIASVDDEQTGWNCENDHLCRGASGGNAFDVFSCSNSHTYNYKTLGDALESVVSTYSSMKTFRGCMDANSDHYAMWEAGFPAVVFSEHSPFNNPHFDEEGGDTYDKVDQTYYFRIAQVGVTFAATLVGIN